MFIDSTGLRERSFFSLPIDLKTPDREINVLGSPDCVNNSSDNETSPNEIPEWILYFGINVHCRF